MTDAWGEVLDLSAYPADNQPQQERDGSVTVRVWIWQANDVFHRGWRCTGPGIRWDVDSPAIRAEHPVGEADRVATHEAHGSRADGD